MLKFVNSGLTQTEVRRARLEQTATPLVAHAWKVLLPVVLLTSGVSVLAGLVWGIIAFVGMMLVGGFFAYMIGRQVFLLAKKLDNGAEQATVVRSGLTRTVTVDELVPGDTVVLRAGRMAPVDVQVDGEVILAGAQMNTDVTAAVVAIGNDRVLARNLTTDAHAMTIRDVFVLGRVAFIVRLAKMTMPRIFWRGMLEETAIRSRFVMLILRVRALVNGVARQQSTRRQIAFLSNQGTVSWSPVR